MTTLWHRAERVVEKVTLIFDSHTLFFRDVFFSVSLVAEIWFLQALLIDSPRGVKENTLRF